MTIICKCHYQNLSFYHFINFSRCVDHYNDHFQGTHNINDKIKCIVEDCGEFLAKKHFRDKTREDLEYIREIEAREKVLSVFNKQRGDFNNEEDYDEYLCMIEDKIDLIV